jgi:hypothetical protein
MLCLIDRLRRIERHRQSKTIGIAELSHNPASTKGAVGAWNGCRCLADFEEVLLVVLVKNATFSVAGIAYDPTERDVFTDRDEKRPCRFFLVEKAKLLPESNLAFYLEKKK